MASNFFFPFQRYRLSNMEIKTILKLLHDIINNKCLLQQLEIAHNLHIYPRKYFRFFRTILSMMCNLRTILVIKRLPIITSSLCGGVGLNMLWCFYMCLSVLRVYYLSSIATDGFLLKIWLITDLSVCIFR